MSKAEHRALEAYPKDLEEYIDVNGLRSVVDDNGWQRAIFLKGYRQAEKDLELSWEDIEVIEKLLGFDNIIESPKEFYQEVLKRFKERKEKSSEQ